MKHQLLILALCAVTLHAQQQKSMGTITTADAQISGGLEVSNQRARLITNASVTAYDHTAQIDLDRGGLVNVCATSAFHLLRSGTGDALLFALDRGAMEIRSRANPQDAILTPDLRFTILTPGVLDLRMRVTREGDSCVENRGDSAPVLEITEGFGDATYHLAPKQHVLFEHGSLREVVDNETSDCGCPPSTPAMLAAAMSNATSTASSQQAAALHPFPAAQSADLAPTKPTVPLPPPSTAAITYGTTPTATQPPASIPLPQEQQHPNAIITALPEGPAAPPPSPPGAHDIFHKIGHFLHHLFHPSS